MDRRLGGSAQESREPKELKSHRVVRPAPPTTSLVAAEPAEALCCSAVNPGSGRRMLAARPRFASFFLKDLRPVDVGHARPVDRSSEGFVSGQT